MTYSDRQFFTGSSSNYYRCLSISSLQWGVPYGVAGHTATVISGQRMVVIGGYSDSYGLLPQPSVYDIQTGRWQLQRVTGVAIAGMCACTHTHTRARARS